MKKIFLFSGAGLSAESGIETFRGHDGLWEQHDVMQVCSTQGWLEDRKLVTRFYDERRIELEHKQPNSAHMALAQLEQLYRGRMIHLTQNVDDLMERAGAKEIMHLHGTLRDLRCEACTQTFDIGYRAQKRDESCPYCGNRRIRHNVVMFGETAPNYALIEQAARSCSLFVAIGTSGTVIDIASLAKRFTSSILIDPNRVETASMYDPHDYIDAYFTHYIQKRATEAMDELLILIEKHFH